MNILDKIDKALYKNLEESIDRRMPHLIQQIASKKSAIRKQFPEAELEQFEAIVKQLNEYDPTGAQATYTPFIVKQAKLGLLPLRDDGSTEDGVRLMDAINFFDRNKNKSTWEHPRDINQINSWRQLEELAKSEKDTDFRSVNEIVKGMKEGSEVVYEFNPGNLDNQFKIIKVTTPAAAVYYGRGTQWCTTCSLFRKWEEIRSSARPDSLDRETDPTEWILGFKNSENWEGTLFDTDDQSFVELAMKANENELPNRKNYKEYKLPNPYLQSAMSTASSYLRSGPLYVIFRAVGDQPSAAYMQLTTDGSQIMNTDDHSLSKTTAALDMVLSYWMASGKAPSALSNKINSIRANSKSCAYPGMLPHTESCKCKCCRAGVSDRIREMAAAGEKGVWIPERDTEAVQKRMKEAAAKAV